MVPAAPLKIRVVHSAEDLSQTMKIRISVFVQEQNVPQELERDSFETESVHLLASYNDLAVGTLRFRKTEKGIKIERVAVLAPFRGQGIGEKLMEAAEKEISLTQPGQMIYLHSQSSAISFYLRLGYKKVGAPFVQAGIEHYLMKKEGN